MKKILLAVVAMAMGASAAFGAVAINWSTAFIVFDNTETDLSGSGTAYLLNNYSAIWQLIYAGPDNTIDPLNDTGNRMDPTAWLANNLLRPGSDDVLWGQRVIPIGGNVMASHSEDTLAYPPNNANYNTTWDDLMTQNSGNVTYQSAWATAGYVYQRIFQIDGTAQGGTWYWESTPFEYDEAYPGGGAPVDVFSVGTDDMGVRPLYQVAVIPEPATMSLLGLGALVMAIRRRRS